MKIKKVVGKVLLLSMWYLVGYMFDIIFGDTLPQFMKMEENEIKTDSKIFKIYEKMNLQEGCPRYETPMIAYYLSYIIWISLGAWVLQIFSKNYTINVVILCFSYPVVYILGMYRKCKSNESYYDNILEINREFFKLSFGPFGFLVMSISSVCTVMGMDVKKLLLHMGLSNIDSHLVNYVISIFVRFILGLVFILILIYMLSLVAQLISYSMIIAIQYFRKYKDLYKNLLK